MNLLQVLKYFIRNSNSILTDVVQDCVLARRQVSMNMALRHAPDPEGMLLHDPENSLVFTWGGRVEGWEVSGTRAW